KRKMSGQVCPSKVRKAAKRLREWAETELLPEASLKKATLVTILKQVEEMPSILPCNDPNVVISYTYCGRYGDFTAKHTMKLSELVLFDCYIDEVYFYERLGKHSQISVRPSKFAVRWSRGKDDEPEDESLWDWREQLDEDLMGDYDEALKAAEKYIQKLGPYDIEKDPIPGTKRGVKKR
ncbi:unnamed protein product, partial [marine sediment metagenome]